MAYTYSDLKTDIRNYTEVDSNVLSDSILSSIVRKAETKIYRSVDTDEEREYATSVLATGNRYVTIPTDICRAPAGALQISFGIYKTTHIYYYVRFSDYRFK